MESASCTLHALSRGLRSCIASCTNCVAGGISRASAMFQPTSCAKFCHLQASRNSIFNFFFLTRARGQLSTSPFLSCDLVCNGLRFLVVLLQVAEQLNFEFPVFLCSRPFSDPPTGKGLLTTAGRAKVRRNWQTVKWPGRGGKLFTG